MPHYSTDSTAALEAHIAENTEIKRYYDRIATLRVEIPRLSIIRDDAALAVTRDPKNNAMIAAYSIAASNLGMIMHESETLQAAVRALRRQIQVAFLRGEVIE